MIIRSNAQSKNIIDKILPLWGGQELRLELAEKLRENDEETSEILNDAGKVTKIYKKNLETITDSQ